MAAMLWKLSYSMTAAPVTPHKPALESHTDNICPAARPHAWCMSPGPSAGPAAALQPSGTSRPPHAGVDTRLCAGRHSKSPPTVDNPAGVRGSQAVLRQFGHNSGALRCCTVCRSSRHPPRGTPDASATPTENAAVVLAALERRAAAAAGGRSACTAAGGPSVCMRTDSTV
jgi:hypothetical protein